MKVRPLSAWHRAIAALLVPMQLFTGPALQAFAADCVNGPAEPDSLSALPLVVSTTAKAPYQPVPKQDRPQIEKGISQAPGLSFSATPTAEEIQAARLFSEPLLPLGGKPAPHDTKALAVALQAFAENPSPDHTAPLEAYLSSFATSPWRVSVLTNLGVLYRSGGYWTKALAAWAEAWELGRNLSGPSRLVDRAFAGRAELLARLGRIDALAELLDQAGNRQFSAAATEKISQAKASLHLMRTEPTKSFRCGPFAAGRVFAALHPDAAPPMQVFESTCTPNGTSLSQVREFAQELGVHLQVARRQPGSEILTPCVIHWKVGHYAALTKATEQGRYLMEDPTFSERMTISTQAIEAEASGLFLVREGALPAGWTTPTEQEASETWGKGAVPPSSDSIPPNLGFSVGGTCQTKGMATYDIDPVRVNLRISDTPIAYDLPRGGSMQCTVHYSQRDTMGATQQYSNLGPSWNLNWITYVIDDPANVATKTYGPGGGILKYEGFIPADQKFAMHSLSRGTLYRTSATSYMRSFTDGRKQYFNLADNGTPKCVFLTSEVDAAGNTTSYNYDASFRLISVVDPMGNSMLLTYVVNNPADPDHHYRVKTVSSLGRTAVFDYNNENRLWKITDPVGIVSEFQYAGSWVTGMTTPYGMTTFQYRDSGADRRLDVTDPLGATERCDFRYSDTEAVPDPSSPLPPVTGPVGYPYVGGSVQTTASYWQNRSSYYWDKKAYAEDPTDTKKASTWHWVHNSANGSIETTDMLESFKAPLESRVFFNYYGQTNSAIAGSLNAPTAIARVMDNGAPYVEQKSYDVFGNLTREITAGDATNPSRITDYIYYINDLVKVTQKNGANNEVLAEFTYDVTSKRQPKTAVDASGQVTTYSYNSYGQVLTVTNPKNETTTFTYDRDDDSDGVSDGYLKWVDGPVANTRTAFAYDGFGRLSTATDPEGYTISYEYEMVGGDPTKTLDRVTAVNFPDGTAVETSYFRLQPAWVKDRAGRVTQYFYNALGQVETVRDALGQNTRYRWCKCGSLSELTDGNGNTTKWQRDTMGRVTAKIYADQTSLQYAYQPKSGRLASVTDARGQVTNYTYRLDGKLSGVSYTNAVIATPSVGYTYDAVYGRLATMTDGIGTTSYGYNAITVPPALGAGMLASVDGPWANDTISYTYDELGRQAGRQIDGTSNPASVAYDSLGRVTTTTTLLGTTTFAYEGLTGRLDYVDLPNTQRVDYDYHPAVATAGTGNGDRRLKQIRNLGVGASGSGAVISQFDYTYGLFGQITNWQQQQDGTTRNWLIANDDIGQLTGATVKDGSGAVVADHQYRYDAGSNRILTQKDQNPVSATLNSLNQLTGQQSGGLFGIAGNINEGGSIEVAGKSVPLASDRSFATTVPITSGTNTISLKAKDAAGNETVKSITVTSSSGVVQTLSYDLNGNQTLLNNPANPAENQSYEWDACDRLVAIVHGSNRTEFTYDGLSLRRTEVEKVSGTVVSYKRLLWDGLSLTEEREFSTNQVTKRHFGFGAQLVTGVNSGNYFYAKDHLGSIREMTDAGGIVRSRYDFDPYGKIVKLSGDLNSDKGFTGHFYHQLTGLHLAPYRAYSNERGRWLSRDPLHDSELNQGSNVYSYAFNAPHMHVDVDGRFIPLIVAGLIIVTTNANTAWAPSPSDMVRDEDGLTRPERGYHEWSVFDILSVAPVVGAVVKGGGRIACKAVGSATKGGIPVIRGHTPSLRNSAQIDQMKADMLSGNYRYDSAEGIISGVVDAKGVVHLSEGQHRMNAALEIFEATGNREFVDLLLDAARRGINGRSYLTPGNPMWESLPLPRR